MRALRCARAVAQRAPARHAGQSHAEQQAQAQARAAHERARREAQRKEYEKHKFHSLGEYMTYLPPGFRHLLVCSPLLGLLCFVLYQQPEYYLDEGERRWRLLRPGRARDPLALLSRPPDEEKVEKPTTSAKKNVNTDEGSDRDDTKQQPQHVAHIKAHAKAPLEAQLAATDAEWWRHPFLRRRLRGDIAAVEAAAVQSPPLAPFHARHGDSETAAAVEGAWGARRLAAVRDETSGLVVGYTLA